MAKNLVPSTASPPGAALDAAVEATARFAAGARAPAIRRGLCERRARVCRAERRASRDNIAGGAGDGVSPPVRETGQIGIGLRKAVPHGRRLKTGRNLPVLRLDALAQVRERIVAAAEKNQNNQNPGDIGGSDRVDATISPSAGAMMIARGPAIRAVIVGLRRLLLRVCRGGRGALLRVYFCGIRRWAETGQNRSVLAAGLHLNRYRFRRQRRRCAERRRYRGSAAAMIAGPRRLGARALSRVYFCGIRRWAETGQNRSVLGGRLAPQPPAAADPQ